MLGTPRSADYAVVERDWSDGSIPSNAGRHRLSELGNGLAELRLSRPVVVSDAAAAEDPLNGAPGHFASAAVGSFNGSVTVTYDETGVRRSFESPARSVLVSTAPADE